MKSKLIATFTILICLCILISCNTSQTFETISEDTITEILIGSSQLETTVEPKLEEISTDILQEFEEVICTEVIDGDTIVIKDKTGNFYKVRYIGIDSSEIGHYYFEEAKKVNEDLLLNKTIKMYKDISETDRYDRLLRYVYVGSIFVNAYLVENGFAKAYDYPPDVKYSDYFGQLQNYAQNKGIGIWKNEKASWTSEAIQKTDGYFIGNKNSKIYHYSYCNSVSQMKESNKVFFNSFEEARAAGYRPCKNCNPPG